MKLRSADEIEREILRMQSASTHRDGPSLKWLAPRVRILRWVLGIEPQSPLDNYLEGRYLCFKADPPPEPVVATSTPEGT